MAGGSGSQLKNLKATLKAAGLTGQTNTKKKGSKHSKKTPNETRKQDKLAKLAKIHEEFNPFDVKVTRNKRADAISKNQTVGKPGISKQVGEENRRLEWQAKTARKNKVGGLKDRRFGENDSSLTAEEKMLERFTRERQRLASKASLYNLDDAQDVDDDDDDGNTGLTHFGKSLAMGFDENDDGQDAADDDDDGDFFNKKRRVDDDNADLSLPQRKKTKAEVMKEVMAKSKFYKHERQKKHEENQEQIMELDDEFGDIMSDLRSVKQPKSSGFQAKSEADIKYDMKVKEAALDRRAAPADRTKTDEELTKEREAHFAKLEADRLRRMEGIEEEDKQVAGDADDLDDDFWAGDSENEEGGFRIKDSDNEESVDDDDDDDSVDDERPRAKDRMNGAESTITIGGKVIKVGGVVGGKINSCPATLEDFLKLTDGVAYKDVIPIIKQVFKTYQPKLGAGNKEKIGVFTCVLIKYTLHLGDEEYSEDEGASYTELIDYTSKIIRELSEKYPDKMIEEFRLQITNIQKRIETRDPLQYPKKSDLVFYTVIGRTFSTSDLYHLVATPAMILIGETLEYLNVDKYPTHLFSGIYLCDLILQYQRLSKRIVPESINFLERALMALIPEPSKINYEDLATKVRQPKPTKFTLSSTAKLPTESPILKLSSWNQSSKEHLSKLLVKLISTLDNYSSLIFKEKTPFLEISKPFITILKHLVIYQASTPCIPSLLSKLNNLYRISSQDRTPLKLQAHRAVAIATYIPKFEENFNPDKKSYDPDRTRQEISKLKHQIKQERKQNLREIRKDSQFEAREMIKSKKREYDEYHAKMAKIINSIQTEEGAAKNEYEREKRNRKNRK